MLLMDMGGVKSANQALTPRLPANATLRYMMGNPRYNHSRHSCHCKKMITNDSIVNN